MVRSKQPKMAVCHPTLPAYAKALCRKCYDSKRWSGQLPTSVSGEARQMAEQVAGQVPRAGRTFESTKYVRTERPAVANFVAGAIVKNFMDVERAVEEIKPDLSPVQRAETAHELENDPKVQLAVQAELERLGLDEASKKRYVGLLWKYAVAEEPEHEKRQLTSLRLLGKAFLPEQVQIERPEALPLAGVDEGLRRMGLDDSSLGKLGPVKSSATDFDEDENNGLSFDS